jgi:hypothetical protein
MGRKGREHQFREIQQLRYYQWEFIRRNPSYRLDYEAFVDNFGKWFSRRGFWYEREKNYSDRDWIFYYNSICPVLKEICARWHICQPLSPEWEFDSKRGKHYYAPQKFVSLPTGYTAEEAAALWDSNGVEIVGLSHDKSEAFSRPFITRSTRQQKNKTIRAKQSKASDPRFLMLQIDTSRSPEELLGEVVQALRLHRDRNRQFFGDSENHTRSRRRLDQYDIDLKVWDMRKIGLTFPEIAKQLYTLEYGSYPPRKNPIVQRVADQHKRAEKLIFGGYKDLR